MRNSFLIISLAFFVVGCSSTGSRKDDVVAGCTIFGGMAGAGIASSEDESEVGGGVAGAILGALACHAFASEDTDGDGVYDEDDKCPETLADTPVDLVGCALDADRDGVNNTDDSCPDTPQGAVVDARGCRPDSDNDGVYDVDDRCPATPAGATVDANGCIPDSDADGVADNLDACPGTPAGVSVDDEGCALDSDRDGVADHVDACPGTVAGTPVDDKGCPSDADGDGVADNRDACPETRAGAPVDEKGCSLDKDNDGVLNASDQCPDTAPGLEVDARGCVPEPPAELVLRNVNFASNSSVLTETSTQALDVVVESMRDNPEARVEIGGHTDDRGTDSYNQWLSQKRADVVRQYLIDQGIAEARVTSRGYGETKPVADNNSSYGRQQNRRIEMIRTD